MVTSDPHIRFNLGAPLIDSKGHGLGSICAIDRKPRQITRQQKRSLSALARAIVAHLEVRRVSADLAASLEDLKTVRGLLPICSHCKGVRDDQGYWSSVEDYRSTHGGLDLTHGICPSCMKAHHPGLYRKMRRKCLV